MMNLRAVIRWTLALIVLGAGTGSTVLAEEAGDGTLLDLISRLPIQKRGTERRREEHKVAKLIAAIGVETVARTVPGRAEMQAVAVALMKQIEAGQPGYLTAGPIQAEGPIVGGNVLTVRHQNIPVGVGDQMKRVDVMRQYQVAPNQAPVLIGTKVTTASEFRGGVGESILWLRDSGRLDIGRSYLPSSTTGSVARTSPGGRRTELRTFRIAADGKVLHASTRATTASGYTSYPLGVRKGRRGTK